MKKQLLGLFLCAGALVSYGQDTTSQQNSGMTESAGITCATLDENTLACFSPDVDINKDNFVSEDEWTNADPNSVGIIDISAVGKTDTTGSGSMESTDTTASGNLESMDTTASENRMKSEEPESQRKTKKDKKNKMHKKDQSSKHKEDMNHPNSSDDARLEDDTETETENWNNSY